MRAVRGLVLAVLLFPDLRVRATELIHLASGFDLEAQSHRVNGTMLTLSTSTGTIEVPAADVLGIDTSGDPAPKAPKSAKPPVADLLGLINTAAASQASTPEFLRFVRCVAQVESALHQDAHSPKGAIGLMQLMPGTATALGVIATNAEENIKGGAKYLRELLEQYHNDSVLALAAYNAGPGAVKKYGGVPPYLETRRYIQKVLREYSKLEAPGATAP
jgi:Transglycosylase SLT domain